MTEKYSAKGRSTEQLLDDYEQHRMDADQKGNTVDYLHAALMARAAEDQRKWAVRGFVVAGISVAVAVAALLVSLN